MGFTNKEIYTIVDLIERKGQEHSRRSMIEYFINSVISSSDVARLNLNDGNTTRLTSKFKELVKEKRYNINIEMSKKC